MKNKGILQSARPTSFDELMAAIDREGNIAFALFRSLVADMVSYEMALCLRQEPELYRWVWVYLCGDILERSSNTFKSEEVCLKEGEKQKPPYVNVCLEIVPDTSRCCLIVV